MSIRDIFEEKFSAAVECASDDVLEAIDYLIDYCEELEDFRESQRKRIVALEKEKNALMNFLASAECADELTEEVEEIASVCERTLERLEILASVRSALGDITASARDLQSSAEKMASAAKECKDALADVAISAPEESDSLFREAPAAAKLSVTAEPSPKKEELFTPEKKEDSAKASDTDDVGDIAKRLSDMLSEEEKPDDVKEKPSEEKSSFDDDLAKTLFSFFGMPETKPADKKPEETKPTESKPEKKVPVSEPISLFEDDPIPTPAPPKAEAKPANTAKAPEPSKKPEASPAKNIGAQPVKKPAEKQQNPGNGKVNNMLASLKNIKNNRTEKK